MLNFGALIAFMGVNAAAFVPLCAARPEMDCVVYRTARPRLRDLLVALAEPQHSRQDRWHHLDGGGIAFGAWKTRGFRGDLVNFDLPRTNKKSQK